MRIDFIATFGMDLTDEPLAKDYAETLSTCTDSELLLDLSDCIIDYEATSIVMDAAIRQLMTLNEPRRLEIVFNLQFPKRLLLKWLFLGSKELNLLISA
jgi:hypothetical protein